MLLGAIKYNRNVQNCVQILFHIAFDGVWGQFHRNVQNCVQNFLHIAFDGAWGQQVSQNCVQNFLHIAFDGVCGQFSKKCAELCAEISAHCL